MLQQLYLAALQHLSIFSTFLSAACHHLLLLLLFAVASAAISYSTSGRQVVVWLVATTYLHTCHSHTANTCNCMALKLHWPNSQAFTGLANSSVGVCVWLVCGSINFLCKCSLLYAILHVVELFNCEFVTATIWVQHMLTHRNIDCCLLLHMHMYMLFVCSICYKPLLSLAVSALTLRFLLLLYLMLLLVLTLISCLVFNHL